MPDLNEIFERAKKQEQERLAEQDSRLRLIPDDGYGRMVFDCNPESALDS